MRILKEEIGAMDIRDAITAEYGAIHQYEGIYNNLENEDAKRILKSIIEEEKFHVGEFNQIIQILFPEESALFDKGKAEASNL